MQQTISRMSQVAEGRMGLRFTPTSGKLSDINAAIWQNFHAKSTGANGLRLTPLASAMREITSNSHQPPGKTVQVWVPEEVEPSQSSDGTTMQQPKPSPKAAPASPSVPPTIKNAFTLEKLRTYGYAGVTGGLCFFSVVNLLSAKQAANQDKTNSILATREDAAWFAFGNAVFSFGDALMDARHLYLGKPETGFTAKYKGRIEIKGAAAKYIAPDIASRFTPQMFVKLGANTLGALVSFYEASIAGDKAGKLQKAKDPDAARAYFHQRTAYLWAGGLGLGYATATFAAGAVASAEAGALALGTAALLAGAAVFFLVASFVAIGVAVYYGMQGEKLTDGPVDIWLDRCWWGKHQGLKGLKPFANAEEELQHYFELFYTPQIVADWDDTLSSYGMDDLDITIYLTGYQPGKSALHLKEYINFPMPGTLIARPLPEPVEVDKMAGVYSVKLPTLKVKDGSAAVMTFRYFPDEEGLPNQMFEITKTFKDD